MPDRTKRSQTPPAPLQSRALETETRCDLVEILVIRFAGFLVVKRFLNLSSNPRVMTRLWLFVRDHSYALSLGKAAIRVR